MTQFTPFQDVQHFHKLMDGQLQSAPIAMSSELAGHRADFKVEEIVELLYATAASPEEFNKLLIQLHTAVDKAAIKVQQKQTTENPLVGQVDALIDLLYFTYGTFVLMGVNPEPLFTIVHSANMGKIFPDGTAHFDPITHKILKPDNWEADFAPEQKIEQELQKQQEKGS